MRGTLFGLLCVLSALLLGSNCEQTEILGPVSFELNPDAREETVVIRLPFVGRTSLDWFIENDGTTDAEFTILALAQQIEDPNDKRCESFDENSDVSYQLLQSVEAPPEPEIRLPSIETNGTLYNLTLEETAGGFEGWARLSGLAGRVDLVVRPSSAELQVLDVNGNTLPSITSENAECAKDDKEIGVRTYRLEDETYRLRVFTPGPSVLLSAAETCISRATVDRICPGTQGELAERTANLPADSQQSGRFHTLDLGVGNAIALTVYCVNDSDCQGRVEIAPYIEPLECRSNDDCSTRRSCSVDGYCLRDSSGCQSASSNISWQTALALFLLLLGATFQRTPRSREGATTGGRLNGLTKHETSSERKGT